MTLRLGMGGLSGSTLESRSADLSRKSQFRKSAGAPVAAAAAAEAAGSVPGGSAWMASD
jgi:hypothetical protein